MSSFNTFVTPSCYSITFETKDPKEYEKVQNLCRNLMDNKLEEPTYEQVLEYCRKRCLTLVDHQFLYQLYNNHKPEDFIPISWIEMWRRANGEQYNVGISSFSQMVADWRRDNKVGS